MTQSEDGRSSQQAQAGTVIKELQQDEGEPAVMLTSPPLSNLLAAFEADRTDAAVVVCGPQRVRVLVGNSGSPGLLPLILTRFTQHSATSPGLYALSAFFLLPEVECPDGSGWPTQLPVIDALNGLTKRDSWEQCAVETFTDQHKVFAMLVRFLAAGSSRSCTNSSSSAGSHRSAQQPGIVSTPTRAKPRCSSRSPQGSRVHSSPQSAGASWEANLATRRLQQRYLGRFPLVFRLYHFREERRRDQCGVVAGCGSGSIPCRSLLLIDAPPAVAGGPVPSSYRETAARIRASSCSVLHAAAGGAPSCMTPIRSALGPLQLVLETDADDCPNKRSDKGGSQRLRIPASVPACPLEELADQARRARCDLDQLITLRDRCQAGGLAGTTKDEAGSGSVGIPAWDVAAIWKSGFGLREITRAEVHRQLPYASRRAERLHALLLAAGALTVEEDSALTELMHCLSPGWVETLENGTSTASSTSRLPGTTSSETKLVLELATLAWQRQWQAQELLGRLDAAEERDALREQVLQLERILEEEQRIRNIAAEHAHTIEAHYQKEISTLRGELAAMRKAHESPRDKLARQLASHGEGSEERCSAEQCRNQQLELELKAQQEELARLREECRQHQAARLEASPALPAQATPDAGNRQQEVITGSDKKSIRLLETPKSQVILGAGVDHRPVETPKSQAGKVDLNVIEQRSHDGDVARPPVSARRLHIDNHQAGAPYPQVKLESSKMDQSHRTTAQIQAWQLDSQLPERPSNSCANISFRPPLHQGHATQSTQECDATFMRTRLPRTPRRSNLRSISPCNQPFGEQPAPRRSPSCPPSPDEAPPSRRTSGNAVSCVQSGFQQTQNPSKGGPVASSAPIRGRGPFVLLAHATAMNIAAGNGAGTPAT